MMSAGLQMISAGMRAECDASNSPLRCVENAARCVLLSTHTYKLKFDERRIVFLDSYKFWTISRFVGTVGALDSTRSGFGIKIDRMLGSAGAQVL
jgi:hypothetical protein